MAAPVNFLDGREIDFEHRSEHRIGDLVARMHANCDTLIVERGAFVTHGVAALALELGEVVVEGLEAGVAPVVLVTETFQVAQFAQRFGFVRSRRS